MAVTSLTVTRTSGGWRLAFASGLADATFYVWRDGVLLGSTTATWWDVVAEAGTYPVWEVFDDAGDEPLGRFPGTVTLQWRAVAAAAHYVVEEYAAGAWVERAQVAESGDAGYLRWTSRWLEDVTSHQFRVTAVGVDGNESDAEGWDVLMVRWPDPPDVSVTYAQGTAKITVSASA